MDHYSTLGISPGASADEIKQAYLRLAKIYHPDRNSSPSANTMMAQINLAYEILCDGQKRKDYDIESGIEATPVAFVEEEQEIGQDPAPFFGKCVKCKFINGSGMFVCSVCGYTYEPTNRMEKQSDTDEEYKEPDDEMSEIIRCPQCNEINTYSRGSCWQCGLVFEISELL